MAYTTKNYKTKKALKDDVAAGLPVRVFQPGPLGPDVQDGWLTLEGPHYPEAHKWYAQAEVKNGLVVKVR